MRRRLDQVREKIIPAQNPTKHSLEVVPVGRPNNFDMSKKASHSEKVAMDIRIRTQECDGKGICTL